MLSLYHTVVLDDRRLERFAARLDAAVRRMAG